MFSVEIKESVFCSPWSFFKRFYLSFKTKIEISDILNLGLGLIRGMVENSRYLRRDDKEKSSMNWREGYCYLCKGQARRFTLEKIWMFECRECGKFMITDWCRNYLKKNDKKGLLRKKLVVYIKSNQDQKRYIEITRKNIKKLVGDSSKAVA